MKIPVTAVACAKSFQNKKVIIEKLKDIPPDEIIAHRGTKTENRALAEAIAELERPEAVIIVDYDAHEENAMAYANRHLLGLGPHRLIVFGGDKKESESDLVFKARQAQIETEVLD